MDQQPFGDGQQLALAGQPSLELVGAFTRLGQQVAALGEEQALPRDGAASTNATARSVASTLGSPARSPRPSSRMSVIPAAANGSQPRSLVATRTYSGLSSTRSDQVAVPSATTSAPTETSADSVHGASVASPADLPTKPKATHANPIRLA